MLGNAGQGALGPFLGALTSFAILFLLYLIQGYSFFFVFFPTRTASILQVEKLRHGLGLWAPLLVSLSGGRKAAEVL